MEDLWDAPGKTWDSLGSFWTDDPEPAEPFKPERHMSQNTLPANLKKLTSLSEDCADGAHTHEASLPLETNTEARIRADLENFKTKSQAYNALDLVLPGTPDPDALVQTARSNGRAFLTLVRDTMKPHLGAKGDPWKALGWPATSIAVPSTSEKVLPLLDDVRKFFVNNPDYEVDTPKLVMTAAKALDLWTALGDAVAARNKRDEDKAKAFQARNNAETTLRTRLRGLIGELEQKLGPMDARWLAFGLNRPGADDPPDAPTDTTAEAMGGGKVFVKCHRVPRADYYQIWIQIVGTDPDFRRVESPDDPEKLLPGLPVGATVKVKMRAVNEANPGAYGDEVEVVVS